MGFFFNRKRNDPFDDIFDLLKNDHRDVNHLFDEIQGRAEHDDPDTDDELLALFHELRVQLLAHTRAEARVVYSELEMNPDLLQIVLVSREEHGLFERVLEDMDEMGFADAVWMAKMKVLRDLVERHVQEEEDDVFPIARKVIDQARRKQLADAFLTAKAKELKRLDQETEFHVEVLRVEDLEEIT